jgi:putative Mn2+ efflux pump MntP
VNFPDLSAIPQWVRAAIQLLTGAVILYFYLKNRKKKVRVDPEKIEYSTAVGMGVIALTLVSSVVITFIFPQDREGWKQAINNMYWITMILLVIGFSFIEYKFRRKKKRLAAQSELENQESI